MLKTTSRFDRDFRPAYLSIRTVGIERIIRDDIENDEVESRACFCCDLGFLSQVRTVRFEPSVFTLQKKGGPPKRLLVLPFNGYDDDGGCDGGPKKRRRWECHK